MLILLPPSETKRSGGHDGSSLVLDELWGDGLAGARQRVIEALVRLSGDAETARRVLRLSERQLGEIAINAGLRTAPTLAAIDRYTGVLFDALDPASLDAPARRWLGRHVLVHSAPFGPIGALDRIPSYRLSAGTSLPGLASLRSVWAGPVARALGGAGTFVLDLRSEAYVALGPIPSAVPSVFVRVVTEGPDGSTRALNHFNKHAKGVFVRALANARPRVSSAASLVRWAGDAGFTVRRGSAEEIHLVV